MYLTCKNTIFFQLNQHLFMKKITQCCSNIYNCHYILVIAHFYFFFLFFESPHFRAGP